MDMNEYLFYANIIRIIFQKMRYMYMYNGLTHTSISISQREEAGKCFIWLFYCMGEDVYGLQEPYMFLNTRSSSLKLFS